MFEGCLTFRSNGALQKSTELWCYKHSAPSGAGDPDLRNRKSKRSLDNLLDLSTNFVKKFRREVSAIDRSPDPVAVRARGRRPLQVGDRRRKRGVRRRREERRRGVAGAAVGRGEHEVGRWR